MEMLRNDLRDLKKFLGGPFRFIKQPNLTGFSGAFRQIVILLMLLSGLVALATAINYDDYLKVSKAQMEAMSMNAVAVANISPWRNVLVLPVMGLALIAMVGLSRHLMVRLMGESNASMAKTQSLAIYSMLPLVLVSALGSVVRILFPEMPAPGQLVAFTVQEFFLTFLLLAAFVLEMLLCIKSFKAQYGQQTGRALLTYLAPMILCNLSCVGIALLLSVFLMGQMGAAG